MNVKRTDMSDVATMNRFWAKVDRRGPEDCWEWQASRTPDGYGHFRLHRKVVGAHRVAYEYDRGGPPPEHRPQVLHRCDNPPCVNPAHLFNGTQGDNMVDATRKGRNGAWTRPDRIPHGIKRPNAKLTDVKVRSLRQRHKDGESQDALAAVFGVCQATVSAIVRRKKWTHLA